MNSMRVDSTGDLTIAALAKRALDSGCFNVYNLHWLSSFVVTGHDTP